MPRTPCLLFCLLLWGSAFPAWADSNAIQATPEKLAPGQTVTLRWYFTGEKVLVSGGRFGKGKIVTGLTRLTDQPKKTTRYTFDVWYFAPATPKKRLHAQYSAQVTVAKDAPAGLISYRSPLGWQISYPQVWKRDHVPTADLGRDGLVFFQKEEDSVERLSVAVLSAGSMTNEELLEQVCADMPMRYSQLEMGQQRIAHYQDTPAVWTTFSGVSQTHPGTRTQSLVLAFVRDGRAYVISARTFADKFKERQSALEKWMKSFVVTTAPNRSV